MPNLRRVGAGLGGSGPAYGARPVNEGAGGLGGRLSYGGGCRWDSGQGRDDATGGDLSLLVDRAVNRNRGSERYSRKIDRHGRENGARWDREWRDIRDYVFVHSVLGTGVRCVCGYCGDSVGSFGSIAGWMKQGKGSTHPSALWWT